MKHCLTILGSTGSIGTQTLDVVRKLGLSVCALAANRNISLLENQIRESFGLIGTPVRFVIRERGND